MGQPPPPPSPSGPPGYPQQPYYGQQFPVQQSNGVGVAGGVVGIVSLVISFIPFFGFVAIPGGIAALVLGIVGLNRAKSLGGAGRGMSITGIVTGAIAIIIPIVFAIAVFSYFATHNINDFGIPSFSPFPT